MPTHTVLRLKGFTSSNDIQAHEEEIPQIGRYEVLIKVRGVTLNYRDLAISKSQYPFPLKDNVVPGSDAAGDIVKIGEGVEGFQIGDRVIGIFDISNQFGPQQDWKHGQAIVKIPEGTPQSYLEWSCLICTGTTAWNALYGNNPLVPGQTVLFQGTGGVSITGLILAKAAGATTIITSSSDEKLEYVKAKWGADYTINYKKTPKWGEGARKITGGRGVDNIFENGGSGTIEQSIAAVKPGGLISVIGFLSIAEQSKMPDVAQLALGAGCIVRGIQVGSKQLLQDCVRFVAERGLRLPVEKEFGFSRDEVVQAYEYLGSGQHIGKVCINVD